MRPTKRFWALAAAGIPIAAWCGFTESYGLIYAYNAMLIVVAWATTKFAAPVSSLVVRRKFDQVLSVRVINRVGLSIENTGLEAISGVLRDEPPPGFVPSKQEFTVNVGPGSRYETHYFLTPNERGDDLFRGSYFSQACPLGLVEKLCKLSTEESVRTYPNVLALREFNLLKQRGRLNQMGIRKSRVRGLGGEFESLREYATGDDYRKIDWKATARRGKIVVRQFEQERNQAVIICLDIGRRMLSEVNGVTKLDHALDSILMVANAVVEAGDQIGLLVFADRVRRYIPPKKGKNQLGILIEAIHDLVAEPVESDPASAFAYLNSRWKRRSLLLTFSDSEDREQAVGLVKGLGTVVRRHLTLLARISDPELEQSSTEPLSTPESLFRRAASMFLIEERRQATTVLEVAGIHTLESEPQNLSSALVSYYFAVKERALI